ncbi:MAG: Gldg family protein [Verrucomicrobiota bacterium]|jgi:hypothetical protein
MPPPDSHPSGFSQGRRWLTTLNLFLATAAMLALVVLLNYLADGHFKRFFWGGATNAKLSPSTLRVLKSLTNDVTVTIFYRHKADVYTMIGSLLAEYQHANPAHLRVADLDYIRSPAEAQILLVRLGLDQTQKDFVAFESNGHRQIVRDSKLSDYNLNDLLQHLPVRRTAFRGEIYFTAALNFLSHPADQKAFFLTGHGERDPSDPSNLDGSGYTNFAGILKNELVCDWQPLALSQTDSIPADCKLLIIASGSQHKGNLSSNELFQIQGYLKHGNGRLLALLDNTEGLDPVLKEWGVMVTNRRVIDRSPDVWSGGGDFLASPAVDNTGYMHPIMRPLFREHLGIRMLAPRPMFRPDAPAAHDPGAPTFTVVAATTPLGEELPNDPALAGAGASPLPRTNYFLIAAIEQNVINGLGGTRIVVAGDSDFLDDQMIDSAANHYFASQTLDWLLQRPGELDPAIGPRPIKEYELFTSQSQRTRLRWLFLAAMPGSVLFLGALVWLRRRS